MGIHVPEEAKKKLANVRFVFEKTWDAYNKEFGTEEDFAAQLEQFARGLPANSRVLDLGCGNGYNAGKLKKFGLIPIGIDSNPDMIATARKEHPDIEFRQMDMLDIGEEFEDESFDGVIAFYALYFLPRSVFDSFVDVLSSKIKQGGSLLIINQLGNGEGYVDESLLEAANENGKNALFTNLYLEQELIEIFKSRGFVAENIYKLDNGNADEIDGDGRIAIRFKKKQMEYPHLSR